jgi:hypothetical protein
MPRHARLHDGVHALNGEAAARQLVSYLSRGEREALVLGTRDDILTVSLQKNATRSHPAYENAVVLQEQRGGLHEFRGA